MVRPVPSLDLFHDPVAIMLEFVAGLIIGFVVAGGLAGLAVRRRLQRERVHAADAERRAAEAEHLAELGTMTGGLAHEIKNPLSTIGLNADLLREDIVDLEGVPDDGRRRLVNRLASLTREIERLRGILDDFLQFAGRIHIDAEPQDLNQLIEELVDFYQPQADRASVRLHQYPSASAAIARVDSHLFKQAVLNLLINATQAFESMDPGHPRELMLRVESDAPQSPSGADRASQPTVAVHVTDTGPGIPADSIKKIFQPYFSTKRGGTGLGLPTARRIIDAHGGRLEVHSELGRGTNFIIRLPRIDEHEARHPTPDTRHPTSDI